MVPFVAFGLACSALVVEADSAPLRDRVEGAFAARSDIDRCAEVTLTTRGASTIVTVTLPDGRSTTRVVRSDAVVDALEPLLVVPEREEEPASVATSTPTPTPTPAPSATFRVESPAPVVIVLAHDEAAPAVKPRGAARGVGVEVGAALSARVAPLERGGEAPGAGLAVGALLDLNDWLVGAIGRFDRYELIETDAAPHPNPAIGTRVMSLAAMGGRRVKTGFVAFDFTGGAGLAQVWPEQRDAIDPTDPKQAAWRVEPSIVPQLTVGSRVTFGARSLVRVFVGLDGEARPMTPSGLGGWSLGASLGLAVGS